MIQTNVFSFSSSFISFTITTQTLSYRYPYEGLLELIFSGFIFPEELFVYCGFINCIKISAHPHSHSRPRLHRHSRPRLHRHSRPHPHLPSCPHLHCHSRPHSQVCVGFISTRIEIFQ